MIVHFPKASFRTADNYNIVGDMPLRSKAGMEPGFKTVYGNDKFMTTT